jgi:hypothetical protein
LYYFHKKLKIKKKQKKTFLVGFFRWVFFMVGFYCQPCYKDHLLRLIDEKQFKSELLAFPLGEETTDIKPEHRADLMPVVLRLLYGRMRAAKAGKKHGGRGAIQGRRALIMHHMLALPEQEVRYFFHLIFEDLFTGTANVNWNELQYILAKMFLF